MKTILYIFLILPLILSSQEDQFNPLKRNVIDSIHSNRLCVEYPGLTKISSTKEAFNESNYVFTGRVTKIIRTEQLEPQDYRLDDNNNLIPLYEEPTYQYWYILKTNKIFKGKEQNYIKIYAKKNSTISPLLMLGKEYLIYAKKGEIQESPYIECGGNSCHIKYAYNDLKEIETILKN